MTRNEYKGSGGLGRRNQVYAETAEADTPDMAETIIWLEILLSFQHLQ